MDSYLVANNIPCLKAYLLFCFSKNDLFIMSEFCCDFDKLCFIFDLSFGVSGMSVTLVTKASKSLSLPLSGTCIQ